MLVNLMVITLVSHPFTPRLKPVQLNPLLLFVVHHFQRVARKYAPITTLLLAVAACSPSPTPNSGTGESPAADASADFTVGMVLVGPKNDAGWNQSHFEGIETAIKQIPGARLEYIDKVNPADRPNVTGAQVADDLVAKGAKLIIFNSDDFKDDALESAKKHPTISVIHASGDYAWKEGKNYKSQPNLGNIMARMEFGKLIAGCAAALSTKNGKIGYVGPLINDETRRYTSAAFLGAKYCWQNLLNKKAEDLTFEVRWIGFWFNIPGKTLDPTKVADDYYNGGFDVVMSGIDTPEVAIQGKKAAAAGKPVKFVHYDYKKGCELAPDICLGVPYYAWNVPYLGAINSVKGGTPFTDFQWLGPVWKSFNDDNVSMVGFFPGQALGDKKSLLDQFIQGLGDGSINPYTGPLNFQDGTPFLKAGETATNQQIWYMPQLIQGMKGSSK